MIRAKRQSIMFKILFIIIFACFVQGAILIDMSYNLTKKVLYSQANESGLSFVESTSQTIGTWLKGKVNEITIYSKSQIVREMDWHSIEPYLRAEISTKLDIYDHLFVADLNGNYNTTLKRNAGNISDRSYFNPVIEGNIVVSEPIISKSTGNQTTVIAAPIKDETGKVIGLIGGSLNLVKLNNFIEDSGINHSDSYSYIIDKFGTIITHPDNRYIMQQNISKKSDLIGDSLVAASKEILNNDSGYIRYIHEEVDSLCYYHTIPNTDNWKLITKVPDEYLSNPLAEVNKDLIIILLVGLIISIIIAIFVSRGISQPIIDLNNIFNKASNGDLNVRAEVKSLDEMGQAAESFNKMMETISKLTYYDTLTALPNKVHFMDRLEHEMSDCSKANERLAVILLDIDKFENVNNALGHSVGEKMLKQLAFKISQLLDPNEAACRLGEDRFVILLPDNPHETYAIRTCMKLLEIMKQPWNIDNHNFYMTASLGIAFYPNDAESGEELLRNALSAMLKAKKNGRGSYMLYDSKLSSKYLDLIELDNYMHCALENNEFIVHYQPQIDLDAGKIVGAEALLRWSNPKLGMISPAKFIPLAEENGLIVPIGDWVLRTACKQNKEWMDKGYGPIYISVNISSIQISQEDFVDKIKLILEETQMPPECLELEITEGIAMEDTETIIRILGELRNLGIRIAIDDFGTGYSSLNYLRKFHITTLKIDQSFIRELAQNTKDEAIVSTILAIGQNLNLTVTAEGVETAEQLEILKEKKCNTIQGYYYSRPVPRDEFEKLLEAPHEL